MTAARPPVASRAVFTAGGMTVTWEDVVQAAQARGSWRELEEATARGLACLARLAATGEEIEQRDLVSATTQFRYARNLLSGDDLNDWLQHWAITPAEWRDAIRRKLLRERWEGEIAEAVARFPVDAADFAAAVWPEAVCSGFIERAAKRLAGDAALAAGEGVALPARLADAAEAVRAASGRARLEAVNEEAVEREIAGHRLEWLRVEGLMLELHAAEVAREAALCIRDDGRTMREVAADIGVEPTVLRVLLSEVAPELFAALLAGREGELIGPIAQNDAFTLLWVDRKVAPTAADPETHRRAEERALQRVVERAVNRYVSWHEPL